MTLLNERLKSALDSLEWSPYRLSQKSGISETTIARLLKSDSANPNESTILSLSKALDVSFEWLFYGNGEMNKNRKTTDVVNKNSENNVYTIDYFKSMVKMQQDIIENQKSIINEMKEQLVFYKSVKPKDDKIEDRLKELEEFKASVILKFKLDMEIEQTEEEIKSEKNKKIEV